MYGIYERQALSHNNRSYYVNEKDHMILNENNEWVIRTNKIIHARISENDICPDFPDLNDWRVNKHGQWNDDKLLRIKAKSETCKAGKHILVQTDKL